ncbi:uncharacterized protein LOC126251500 [Schistocerca nitens]|uniref:uncharacterized protein LOC126251500 n=1 Tax=Schistocerca nitens TaxID=7011 RepID=UPI002117E219|nr:uncharacterized protein LOC126251500 [Schistocerca nitens]
MSTANLLVLLPLLLAASCFAQDQTAQLPQGRTTLGDGTCSLQATTITCVCLPGQKALDLTAPFMEGSGAAEVLEVSSCPSVTFAFPPLQNLHTLRVAHTARATFQEKASPLLRHLALVNISEVELQGPTFQGAALETVLLDGVRISVVRSGAFAGLSKIQNVTFRDVRFNAVLQGAVELQMVGNSELTILRSELLSVMTSGIVVKGVTNFTMHESRLTTKGDDGLQLDAAGAVSVSDSQLKSGGAIQLAVPSGATFRFVNNVWKNSSLLVVGQQLLQSGAAFDVTNNTFQCACDPALDAVLRLPMAAALLDNNRCDESLCGQPVPMRVLASCHSPSEKQAACEAALPAAAATAGTASAPPSTTNRTVSTTRAVTVSPRAAKPLSPGGNNTAAAIAVSVTAALLLTVPAAAALAL